MQIKLIDEDNTSLVGLCKEDIVLVIRKNWTDGFVLDTAPFDYRTTFTILKNGDEVEKSVFDIFVNFIAKIVEKYKENERNYFNKDIHVNFEERTITIDWPYMGNKNYLKFQCRKGAIDLEFVLSEGQNLSNNAIVLDNAGNISWGYYRIFVELFEQLVELGKYYKSTRSY